MATTNKPKRETKKNKMRRPPSTSPDDNDFASELGHAGNRSDLVGRIELVFTMLRNLGLADADLCLIEVGRAAKKNFAQNLSAAIAQKTANILRRNCPGVHPDASGRGHESISKGAAGPKKIDVNYSTLPGGLELAVSIKTVNFSDGETSRYTKNTKRVDGELRAEAQDCHNRHRYAVLAAYIFLPWDSAEDGKTGPSSLKHFADVLSRRSGRRSKNDEDSLFEFVYIGLYRDNGYARFFSVSDAIPDRGAPASLLRFSETLSQVCSLHKERNPSGRQRT